MKTWTNFFAVKTEKLDPQTKAGQFKMTKKHLNPPLLKSNVTWAPTQTQAIDSKWAEQITETSLFLYWWVIFLSACKLKAPH